MNSYFSAKGANQPAIVLAVITLALAGMAAWFGYETGRSALYGGAAALVIIALLITQLRPPSARRPNHSSMTISWSAQRVRAYNMRDSPALTNRRRNSR